MNMPAGSSSPDDIGFRAYVDDQTGVFFDKFDKEIADMQARTQRLQSEYAKMSTGMANSNNSLSAKSAVAFGAIATAAGVAMNVVLSKVMQAAAGMQNFINGCTQAAARAETLSVALNVVGGNMGYSKDQLAEYEAGLRKTGISILASREALLKMGQANLDLAQSSKIARVAQDAAVIAGTDSSAAFNRIVWALQTLNPRILRTMGIMLNLNEVYRDVTKETGKKVTQLSMEEKQQALLNAVLEKGKTIQGAYEAAMTTAGKKAGSLRRYMSDLQVTIGEIFQKGYANQIDAITERIKVFTKWVVDNRDELMKLGEIAADVTKIFLDLSTNLVKFITYLDLKKNLEPTMQTITMISALTISMIKAMQIYFDFLADTVDALNKLLSGDVVGYMSTAIHMQKELADANQQVSDAFFDTFYAVGEYTGAIEKAGEVTDDTSAALNKAKLEAEALAAAMQDGADQLNDFLAKMQEDATQRIIAANRAYIEAELKASWAAEDAAREHAEAVQSIIEDSNQAQKDAAANLADKKLDIEKNYQRTLEDLRTNFERNATELARARDAVGLLKLMRQNQQQLEDAKKTKDRQTTDAQEAYDKQLVDLKQSEKEKLAELAKSEKKQQEEQRRSYQRQEQLQKLHEQWAEEDRQRAYAKQLSDLETNILSIEGMTQEGLNTLLKQYAQYFGILLPMAQSYMDQVNTIMTPGGSIIQTPSGSPNAYNWNNNAIQLPPSPTVTGQAGQVSSLLANTGMYRDIQHSRVPSVVPRGSSERRDITVRVEGNALEPYIQRQIAVALIEVERNR